jgi:cysteinyl-tRNA synthetase
MSKSLGNVTTLREAIDEWGRETLLLLFLGSHWRKPMDFSEETLAQASAQAETFRDFFLDLDGETGIVHEEELTAVLDDDFNTAEALALFHDWRARGEARSLRRGLGLFGLASLAEPVVAPVELTGLAKKRDEARQRKDFAESDRIRDEISAAGWTIRDISTPPGFRLVPKR